MNLKRLSYALQGMLNGQNVEHVQAEGIRLERTDGTITRLTVHGQETDPDSDLGRSALRRLIVERRRLRQVTR